jgi:NAD(P)-dependent dehydrogenase (short-subunit alcohol dehydrogenase family)
MKEVRTALVTGAASGIGAVIAERFLAAGYRVAWFDIDAQAAAETAARVGAPERRIVIAGDVANESHVRDAVARTVHEFGRLDVLINNAGIEIYGTVVEMSSDEWDRQLAVNLKGAYLFSKYAIPQMRQGARLSTSRRPTLSFRGRAARPMMPRKPVCWA